MAFECRLLCVVRLSIFGRFVFLESAISIRFVWDFSEIWICGLYIPVFRNEIKSNYQTASKTFEKAFKCIENDPSTAIGLANSALESIAKEILQDKRLKIQYNPKDTLYKLTQNILKAFGMFPSENIPMEIKTICSNLLGIGKSIEDLRSTKTEFHGKVNGDYIVSESVFVYLCFNSICTVGLFLLSYYKEIFPKQQIEQSESIDDVLPF